MISSPRLIAIKFGYGFDPAECLVFTIGAELCDLRRDPVAHGFRARIGHDEAQLTQALRVAPPAHPSHPLSRLGRFILHPGLVLCLMYRVTERRQEPGRA